LRRAPAVEAFGETGVRAVYHFVVGGAQGHALRDFLSVAQAGSFAIMPMTIQMDGVDTMFVHGRAALHDQNAVDREFRTACALGGGGIYLTHVRHNPAVATGDIRVR